MRDALLIGPGYGWSGFTATTAAQCAPSTLASGAGRLAGSAGCSCVRARGPARI